MADTKSRPTPGSPRSVLEQMRTTSVPRVPPSFAEAVRAVLTGIDYNDPALIKSAMIEVRERLADSLAEAIESRLDLPAKIEDACLRALAGMEDHPLALCDATDDVGEAIEGVIGGAVRVFTELRDGPVQALESHGFTVRNSDRLHVAISRLTALREHLLGGWLRTTSPLPATDREMVRQSRAEIDRGGCATVEEVIRQCGGEVE